MEYEIDLSKLNSEEKEAVKHLQYIKTWINEVEKKEESSKDILGLLIAYRTLFYLENKTFYVKNVKTERKVQDCENCKENMLSQKRLSAADNYIILIEETIKGKQLCICKKINTLINDYKENDLKILKNKDDRN